MSRSAGGDLVAHAAVALRAHVRRERSSGREVPAVVHELADLLTLAVRSRQGPSWRDAAAEAADHDPVTEPLLLTKADAARALSVSVSSLERLMRAGELKTVRIASAVRIRKADLDAYTAALAPRTNTTT